MQPQVLRGVAPPATCRAWLASIDALDRQLPADHPDRQATSGSLRLRALPVPLVATILDVARSAAEPHCTRVLGAPGSLLEEACWVRRQYPVSSRPPGQYPHQWHQDGALGCRFEDFEADAYPPPRNMLTLWLPLVDCGEDAPSLEWAEVALSSLLGPQELHDDRLAERFGADVRRHAVLSAGDALAFDGALLHRTHVTSAMQRRRVSLEWRFVAQAAHHGPG